MVRVSVTSLRKGDGGERRQHWDRRREGEAAGLPTPPVSEGQRLAGTEVQISGPCVSVKANWWCSKFTGTFVAVPAVTPELRLVTVTVCVQEPVPLPLRLKLGGVPPVTSWISATLQTPGT